MTLVFILGVLVGMVFWPVCDRIDAWLDSEPDEPIEIEALRRLYERGPA